MITRRYQLNEPVPVVKTGGSGYNFKWIVEYNLVCIFRNDNIESQKN